MNISRRANHSLPIDHRHKDRTSLRVRRDIELDPSAFARKAFSSSRKNFEFDQIVLGRDETRSHSQVNIQQTINKSKMK